MANIQEMTRSVFHEAQEGVAWIAVWKESRSWCAESFWPDFDGETGTFKADKDCIGRLEVIASDDPDAVFLNGYHCNLGSMEEMTLKSLANFIRWHYEVLQDAQLEDALDNFELTEDLE